MQDCVVPHTRLFLLLVEHAPMSTTQLRLAFTGDLGGALDTVFHVTAIEGAVVLRPHRQLGVRFRGRQVGH